MAAPGMVLEDRYRLDSRIAAGGMGEVWRSTDLILRREVAVKLLLPEYARDAESAARFRAEARHAGMVSHPNIAQIFDYSEGDGSDGDNDDPRQSYLVMELVDGPPLAGLLADGPVGPAYTLGVLAQVCAGLAAAHAVDLVHRDIKPANLLISKSGLVKITDFGIAFATGAAPITRTGEVVGTGAYLAPERFTRGQVGPAADLYSLGVVAYECLTGERPFNGEPLAVLMAHQDQPLPPLPPEVPESVAALVADLTAKDPGSRPASATEVAERAKQLRAELGEIAPPRPDLPALAGATLGTGQKRTQGAIEATAVHAGSWQREDATRQVTGVGPAGKASDAVADGEAPPRRRHDLFGRIGPRTGLAAAAIVAVGIGALVFAILPGQSSHMHMTDVGRPVVQHTNTAAPASATATPTQSGASDLATVPASTPVTPSVSPYPSASVSPSYSPSPSASASASPTSTPSRTQSPTSAPTSTASVSPSGSPGAGTGSSG